MNNVDERVATVERAQAKLEQQYTIARHREQVLDVIARAHPRAKDRCHREGQNQETRAC